MKTESKPLYIVDNPKKKTVFDYVADYLFEKYDIRYNEISHDFQISFRDENSWHYLNIHSLIIELTKAGIEISPGKLEIFIKSELIAKHNPIQTILNHCQIGTAVPITSKTFAPLFLPTKMKHFFIISENGWFVRLSVPWNQVILTNKHLFLVIKDKVRANQPGAGFYVLPLCRNTWLKI